MAHGHGHSRLAKGASVDLGPGIGRRGTWATIRDLLPHLWPRNEAESGLGIKARVVGALACLVAAKAATVTIPLFYQAAVDALTKGPASDAALLAALPIALIVGYGVARVLSLAMNELRDALFAKVQQRAVRSLALLTFGHLHALSMRFHMERQTGGLARVIERGTKAIEGLIFYTLLSVVPTTVELVLACGVLWALFGLSYAAIVMVTVALYGVWSVFVSEWRTRFRREMNEMDTAASSKAIDSLLNYETVKYFANEEHEARRYDRGLASYERAATRSKASLSLLNIGQAFILSGGLTILMVMAATEVRAGTMTLGGFVAINAYMMQLAIPLNFLGMMYREIKQAIIDMEAMFRLLLIDREVEDKPGAPALRAAEGRVTFDRVAFGYDARRPILADISFEIPPGRTLAVVGPSGAGKSTLTRLLFRFYDVDDGAVRIDGQDLRDVTQASLRRSIGVVPQDTVLFNDTVYYNIAYGRTDATPAEVERAARLARIHDFVMATPDGYQTKVGERGLKLSGGEKQRVAIARTILKDPRILILDEATSALDSRTEQEIQQSLKEVARERTTLVIAHRLSTIVDADEILVLAQGRIVERGRHGALLAAGGTYAQMWARQQEAAEEGTEPAAAAPAAAD